MAVNSFSGQPAIPASYGFTAGKNKIINGDFSINQRNFTSNTTTGTYNFDRWQQLFVGGTQTITPQTFTLGTAPVSGYEGKNFCRVVTASQSANGDYSAQIQKIESVRTFANQTITVSFWAKASTGTPNIGVSGLQNFGTGGSPSSSVIVTGSTTAITSSWTRYSFTLSVPSIAGKTIGSNNDDHFRIDLWTSVGTTISGLGYPAVGLQNVTIDFWGVQVEAGSVATPFQTATGTLQGELAACQRYYQRFTSTGTTGTILPTGVSYSATGLIFQNQLMVPMRVSPTAVDYANVRGNDSVNAYTLGTITITANDTSPTMVNLASTSTGMTTYRPIYAQANGTVGYIGLSAEL